MFLAEQENHVHLVVEVVVLVFLSILHHNSNIECVSFKLNLHKKRTRENYAGERNFLLFCP